METHTYSQTDTQFQEPLSSPREAWEGRGHGACPRWSPWKDQSLALQRGQAGWSAKPRVLIEKIRPS